MRDEMRKCQCGAEHPWGIVRKSEDGVNLYGPRAIATCDRFRPQIDEREAQLAASVNLKEVWEQTQDLSPQATLATRVVVARLRDLGKDKNSYGAMAAQWPDFMGFLISQITDMRGTLVRDENKFSHLVAHTDEIVESMRGVVQLSERLSAQSRTLHDILERVASIEASVEKARELQSSADAAALKHFGLGECDCPALGPHDDRNEMCRRNQRWRQEPKFEQLLSESAAATKPDEPVETVSHPIPEGDGDREEEEARREQPEDDEEPREKKGFE